MAKKIVLLKNENELLPLKKSGLKIALIDWQMIRLAHWVVGELQLMTKVLFQY
jgi:hypothetical protein